MPQIRIKANKPDENAQASVKLATLENEHRTVVYSIKTTNLAAVALALQKLDCIEIGESELYVFDKNGNKVLL